MAILDLTAHPVAAKYAVLVDVGYLYAAAGEVLLGAKERKEYKVAADELIQALQKHAEARIHGELLRIYWYDAARDRVPTVDQRVIAQLPWVKVRLGNLNARGQQKGVDAQIRSDLEALARHHAVSDTILLAGDEDMVPAVEAAQAYGVRIHLWGVEPPYGTNQAERLVWEADTVEILSADFLRDFFSRAPQPVPVPPAAPSPAQVFAGRTPAAIKPKIPAGQVAKLGPSRPRVEEVGEHVAQKWILTRGRDNIRDLLPGPILPTVIDTELLIEAEKELGHSLRPFPEARVWLRDGFWARVYREFDLGVGISSK
ncbi:NYN domain-containing protein [Planomonospora sp. ID91781]|uniref:NYN domain containing protein n=3 Tax=Planomonospora TaxID=1998 RepID=A0A171BH97_9ACTN|nr:MULTISPECIES: NYN domain-containing protein [Planomonospora]MBG0820882.1 NYN domain-containing protein [Planomonospora sp. ID91781]GAT65096.1 NYN domain containing protein [Planomonospora sphaerica]GGK59041.1 NYN domain-containing protein [Planomonospora parontospora]GGL52682.1 NYN domain-containing protein [Planomonospora parontospora subsp. antibiotica]GII07974.1 NYN domain-containing protein [Planomonospora parontospora subsp. parontospora]